MKHCSYCRIEKLAVRSELLCARNSLVAVKLKLNLINAYFKNDFL
jgi:hypothetical protein